MAYDGNLLYIHNSGSDTDKIPFPLSYIKAETYSAYINMQDVDPWTDANGYLHRTAVGLKALKVEFETKALLTSAEYAAMTLLFRGNYIDANARTLKVTAFIPELDDYVTQVAYVADTQPTIYTATGGVIKYNPVKYSIIGGVYSV